MSDTTEPKVRKLELVARPEAVRKTSDPELIKMLEDLLVEAKAGELVSLSFATCRTNDAKTGFYADDGQLERLLGYTSVLRRRIEKKVDCGD